MQDEKRSGANVLVQETGEGLAVDLPLLKGFELDEQMIACDIRELAKERGGMKNLDATIATTIEFERYWAQRYRWFVEEVSRLGGEIGDDSSEEIQRLFAAFALYEPCEDGCFLVTDDLSDEDGESLVHCLSSIKKGRDNAQECWRWIQETAQAIAWSKAYPQALAG